MGAVDAFETLSTGSHRESKTGAIRSLRETHSPQKHPVAQIGLAISWQRILWANSFRVRDPASRGGHFSKREQADFAVEEGLEHTNHNP